MAGPDRPPIELHVQFATDAAGLPPDTDWENPDFQAWVTAAFAGAGVMPDGGLTIRLVGLDEGTALNETWRRKTGPTNVLAFPGPAPGGALPPGLPREYGDLVICLPVVAGEAARQGKKTRDHLTHLVVHGTLHLLGYTHDAETDAARMEALETRVLATLGIPDPYVTK